MNCFNVKNLVRKHQRIICNFYEMVSQRNMKPLPPQVFRAARCFIINKQWLTNKMWLFSSDEGKFLHISVRNKFVAII